MKLFTGRFVFGFSVYLLGIVLRENCVVAVGPAVPVLLDLAKQHGAPFAETALKRLQGHVFGSGRSTRSVDVVIINASEKSFNLKSSICTHGSYSTSLFPEPQIMSKVSSVFGMESYGLATGVKCTTKYESSDGSFFQVIANNPYIGGNSISESFSKDLHLTPTLGKGENNHVRWIIQSVNSP